MRVVGNGTTAVKEPQKVGQAAKDDGKQLAFDAKWGIRKAPLNTKVRLIASTNTELHNKIKFV